MKKEPAGWYPEPDGGAGLRWWDGERWTPRYAEPAPGPRNGTGAPNDPRAVTDPVVEHMIQRGPFMWQKARLTANDEMLRYGNDVIPIDAVETVSYQVARYRKFGIFTSETSYEFVATGGGVTITVHERVSPFSFRRNREATVDRWEALVDLSQRRIEPRLRGGAIEGLRSGLPIVIGTVTLSREGVVGRSPLIRRTASMAWPAVLGSSVTAGQVVVEGVDDEGRITVAESMMTPNAPLIPELVDAVRRELTV